MPSRPPRDKGPTLASTRPRTISKIQSVSDAVQRKLLNMAAWNSNCRILRAIRIAENGSTLQPLPLSDFEANNGNVVAPFFLTLIVRPGLLYFLLLAGER